MADKQYRKLPANQQTTAVKNFFESTVEQLFSKANVEQISGYIGRREFEQFEPLDRYVVHPTSGRNFYSFEPVVSSVNTITGRSENNVFFEDFKNILKSYGSDTSKQNILFDTDFYSFLPPINIDKFINYQEYFWSPTGPTPKIITSTSTKPINVEKDILGKKSYTTPDGTELKNGMIISFAGDYVIPESYKDDQRWIVEGVGESIILFNREQNFATTFATELNIPYDNTLITNTDTLISTTGTSMLSGGLIGLEDPDGTTITDSNKFTDYDGYVLHYGDKYAPGGRTPAVGYQSMAQVDPDTGTELWSGYISPIGTSLQYVIGGAGAFDTQPFDSDNTQTVPDYIVMQRGAKDNNVWSRINFWYHRQNFIDAGDQLPPKSNRAVRPILEFERDIELFNFGSTGIDAVEISAYDSLQTDVIGRPTNSVVDSVTLRAGNKMVFPLEPSNVSQHIYQIDSSTTATVDTNVSSSTNVTLTATNDDIKVGAIVTEPGNSLNNITVASISGTSLVLSGTATLTAGTVLSFDERVFLKRIPASTNPVGAVDGDSNFVPYTASVGDVVSIKFGANKQGVEYYWNGTSWAEGQKKEKVNTPILFNAYDVNKKSLNNEAVYPNSSFAGNKVFSYKEDPTIGATKDSVLGMALSYKNYNNFSELVFLNNLDDDLISYKAFGATQDSFVKGYVYYKKTLPNNDVEYDTIWKTHDKPASQKVKDQYIVSQTDLDTERTLWKISAKPIDQENSIRVYINDKRDKTFSFESVQTAITFGTFNLKLNDVIDIETQTNTGEIIADDRFGHFEIPMSWSSNFNNSDIKNISQPEYLEHFRNYVKEQELFSGDPLGTSNFDNLEKDQTFAKRVVQTDEDLQMAAWLVSNDKYNIIDAINFNANEYVKYKARLKSEIRRYIDNNDTSTMTDSEVLEFVLQNVIAFNPGKLVFDYSYMLAFGDKYTEERITINNVATKKYTLTNYLDCNNIQNTIYVYDQVNNVDTMLLVDKDYTINSLNGVVTLEFLSTYNLTLGNIIKIRLFDLNRESTQTPPTPSAMGITPLYEPELISDTSFSTPLNVIVGHDGSRTVADNDITDSILLEYERRVYNNTLQAYRDNDSYPDLNVHSIRPGRFRSTGLSRDDFHNLIRNDFNQYVSRNNVDFVTNEFYDASDLFTWNYNSGTEKPGYWRGIYESCYDTERPHTHPWEMLGFTKKPSYWDSTYGTDYTSKNKKLWKDLEDGKIRSGSRENLVNNRFRTNNPYRRVGLKYEIPVDENGNLIAPANIISTTSTTKTIDFVETTTGTGSASANTFITTINGLNVTEIGSNIIVSSTNGVNHTQGTYPSTNNTAFIDLDKVSNYNIISVAGSNNSTAYANATTTSNTAIGVAVNGAMIFNSNTGVQHSQTTSFNYNSKYRDEVDRDTAGGYPDSNNVYGYECPGPEVVGLTEWATDSHAPIVGWAFDGYPIYGPYGYTDRLDNTSAIKRLETGYNLKTGIRTTVGGTPTGEFIEDYEYSSTGADLDEFNGRFGITPEFPSGTYYYVATIDADSKPAFPYTVGGKFAGTLQTEGPFAAYGEENAGGNSHGKVGYFYPLYLTVDSALRASTTNGYHVHTFVEHPGVTFYMPNQFSNHGVGSYDEGSTPLYSSSNAIDNGTATYTLKSTETITFNSDTSLTNNTWKFGDVAPVENSWKISEGYPFAIASALYLTKPGKFASVFAEPQKIVRGSANTNQLLENVNFRRFKIKNSVVHGSKDIDNKLRASTGYTQFIDSYMRFQGLDTNEDFAIPFQTVTSKLGSKLAGYIDKDTMTVFLDNYTTTGNSSSLILPQEDIQVDVHTGPYSTTNDYTGVLVELTDDAKYKVFGFNSIKKHFDIEPSLKDGPRTQIEVGGEPSDFTNYSNTTNYPSGSIVKSGFNFFRAKSQVDKGIPVTNTETWERLASLPQIGGAKATLYLEGTGEVARVEYGTEYDKLEDVFDLLISIGRQQKNMGYVFDQYDNSIGDVNDWTYSGKQFLFWTLGNWASGNTISLSPGAGKVTFQPLRGRVSPILESDQGQFSILDDEGKVILPTECIITREDTEVTISPPAGKQLYGVILYTDEIEHSLLINNRTTFGDTIFDDVFNARQKRVKLKGTRTKNWNGTLTAEGYIITNNGLKPNYDTLADDMRRYTEIGHVPVEKNLYDLTRRQYGYAEKKYLREFELINDNQFDFYRGMIKSKGTKNAIETLLNSNRVLVPGSVAVYDEWALKAGDFGDTDNKQSLDVKITTDEITSESQLIQIAFPENIVSKVKEVEVLDRTTLFYQQPILEIEPPPAEIPGSFTYGGGTTAKATVNISQDGTISDVTIDEPGYGYTINPAVTVIAAQLLTANVTTNFLQPYAVTNSVEIGGSASGQYVDHGGIFTGGNALTNGMFITDHFAPSANANAFVDFTGLANIEAVANLINNTADVNANITANTTLITTVDGSGNLVENYQLTIKGNDFTLSNSNTQIGNIANVNIEGKRYQPRQRFSFESANSTTYSDVVITVDGNTTTGNATGSAGSHDWEFDNGSRTTVISDRGLVTGNVSETFSFQPISTSNTNTLAGSIATDNLNIINGSYPHIEVYVNNSLLSDALESDSTTGYTITNVDANTNNIIFHDVGALPGGQLDAQANILIVEKPTVDFTDTYQGDLPGSTLNIKVFANDALAAKLEQVRTYEITPDDESDNTILIDVDDSERLVVRPSDMAEKSLWPLTQASSVSYVGIIDSKYDPLPNAGYVSKYDVDYQAMDIFDAEKLFDNTVRRQKEIPAVGNIIHVARGEHIDFDVYELEKANVSRMFVEYDAGAQVSNLFSDVSLDNLYKDKNLISKISADITGATADGTNVTFTANQLFSVGDKVTMSNVTPSVFNLANADIIARTDTSFTIASTISGSYSGGGLATSDYDNTRYFDGVIALKGNTSLGSNISDYQANLVTSPEGEKQFDTTELAMNKKLMLYVDEQRVENETVEVANLSYNAPVFREISTITPKNSGTITNIEAYPYSSQFDSANANFSAQANVLGSGIVQISIEQDSNATTRMSNIDNGRFVRFADSTSSNLNNNSFIISNVIHGDGNVTNTLSGYANIGTPVQVETSNITSNTTIVYIDEVKDSAGNNLWLNDQSNAALGDYTKDFNLAGDRFFSPVETTANIFIDGVNLHANGKVNYVVLSEKVGVASNIAANTNIDVSPVEAQFVVANTTVTSFTINDSSISGNIAPADLSASIDDGMLISTSATVGNLIAGDSVFVNNAGKFTDSYIVRQVEPTDDANISGTGKFLVSGFYSAPYSNALTVNGAVTDSPNVILSGSLNGIQEGMLVSGTGVTAGTTISEITSASNITLSANANISNSATLTFTDDVFGQADVVDNGITVTLREAHDHDTTGNATILGQQITIDNFYPFYYNRVWEVKSVPTSTTLELEGFAVGNPHAPGDGNTYITKAEYDLFGSEALQTRGGILNYQDVDGDGNVDLIPTLLETDKGIYTFDGAEVVTRAYNYLNTDELVDEINRQITQKENVVLSAGSFNAGFPVQWSTMGKPFPGMGRKQSAIFRQKMFQKHGHKLKFLQGGSAGSPPINNTATNMQNPASYNNHFGITAPPGRGAVYPGMMAQNQTYKPIGYPGQMGPQVNHPTMLSSGPVKSPNGTVTPGNPTTIGGTPPVTRNPITPPVPPAKPAPTYLGPNMSGTITAGGPPIGATLADFTPIYDITQNDEPCPPPPPPKPLPPVPDAVTVCAKISNTKGTGVTEWKTFKFTSNNTFDYTIKILFDMYSAKDKLTIYQSSSTQPGSGRVIASTNASNGLSQLSSTENNELKQAFGIASGSHYGGLQNYNGPDSSGFLTFAGKLTFPYNADNGRYIHAKLEKNKSSSIAYRYYICYPQDQGQTTPITTPPTTATTPKVTATTGNYNLPGLPINAPMGIPNFGNYGGGAAGYSTTGVLGGVGSFSMGTGLYQHGTITSASTSTFTAGYKNGSPTNVRGTQRSQVPGSSGGGQALTGTKFISLAPLAKKNGKYQQKFAPVQIPVCLPKSRVKICGEPLGVGKGDSFKIDDCTINMDLGANATLTNVKNAIESQCDKVIVNISASPNTKEKCLSIIKKASDPMVIRNGCAGGILKEVLDYSAQKTNQVQFNSHQEQAAANIPSTTVTFRNQLNQATDQNSAYSVINPASTTNFVTNTISADSKKRSNQVATRSGVAGTGYTPGDILRVVGGTPVVRLPSVSIEKLTINNAGVGYNDPKNPNKKIPIEIIIGTRDEPGGGAIVDYENIEYDEQGGIISIPLLNTGRMYSPENPPTITIKGAGSHARVNAKFPIAKPVERVAKFMVTQTGPNGEPLNFACLDRGVYKEFPSDLDSGLPLEYDIKRITPSDKSSDTLGTAGVRMGPGSGARIYLTSRFIPDCSEKGNALKDLGLAEGVYPPLPPEEHFAETINDFPIFGPDGFPLIGAEILDQGDGVAILKIGGPDIDGIRFGDELNPGLLDLLGILPGDYIKDELPVATKVNDGKAGSDQIGFLGPHEINTTAGDVIGGNAGMYQYTLLDLQGNPSPVLNNPETRLTVDGLVLKSLRYPTPPTGFESMANVWIDNYDANGWAYLEANSVIRKQEALVDTKRITDIFTYDENNAHKEFDIDLYDPFKGVIPGFIGKDINYRSTVDPVVYDSSKTEWGREQVGKTWWWTLNSIYQWYEQGSGAYGISRYVDGGIEKIGYNNTERAIGWGEMFPNSTIEIFEWIESTQPPSTYSGVGAPKNNLEFIQEDHVDARSGKTVTYYYYWVRGLMDVSDLAKQKYGRDRSTADLERLLEDPYAERVAFAGIVSPDGMIVNTLGSLIKTDESILSVNFKRKDPIASQKHSSWRLIGEGDPQENIPENLSVKLIDSLAGYNAINQVVPTKGLSIAERFGSNFRPNQTMFKNLRDARKQMFDSLNDIFREVKMDSTFLDWRDNLPTTMNYLETVNWFEKLRISGQDNSQLYYNEDYKPLRKVTDTKQFDLLTNVLDKSIIQVQKNNTSKYELYEYSKSTDTFKLIAKEDETARWKTSVYTDVQTQTLGSEIRQILFALYKNVFVGSGHTYWNKFFFSMMKHAYAEQGELDWAFKSTYLKVEKEETDLIPFKGFKVDNFDKAVDYFNEVKPYSSKIRNYSDIKKTPVDIVSGTTTDFDRPPYFDESISNVRILDESVNADVNILSSNAIYTGYNSNNSLARQSNTTIVFDRVKGDLFENSTGGKIETVVADGSSAGFSFNIDVKDQHKFKVLVDGDIIPETSKNRDAIRGITGSLQTISLGNDANAFLVLSSTTALSGSRTPGTYANVTGISNGAGSATFDTIASGNGNARLTYNNFGADDVNRVAGSYSNVSGTSNNGSATVGTYDIVIGALGTVSSVTANIPGTGHVVGDTHTVIDALLGAGGAADLTFDVATVNRTSGTFTNVATTSSSSGTGTTVDVVVDSIGTVTGVTANVSGNGYAVNDTLTVADSLLGNTGANDVTFDIATLDLSVGNINVTVEANGAVGAVSITTPGSGHAIGDIITVDDSVLGNGGAPDVTLQVDRVNRTPGTYANVTGTSGSSNATVGTFTVVVDAMGNVTATPSIVTTGFGNKINEVITIPDSVLGNAGANALQVNVSSIANLTVDVADLSVYQDDSDTGVQYSSEYANTTITGEKIVVENVYTEHANGLPASNELNNKEFFVKINSGKVELFNDKNLTNSAVLTTPYVSGGFLTEEINNYNVDFTSGFVTFDSNASLNPRVGTPVSGTEITFMYFDGYDPTAESLNVSIATNIVNVESNANINISNVQQKWTAPEKIWKYDPLVRSEIDKAFDLVYGEGSTADANIIQNVSIVTDMINSGNLTPALNLVKRKVGANFQGRELDASVFTDIVPGTHSTTFYTDTRGWDVFGYDTDSWDKEIEVENFIGIFDEATQGNVNYRVDDETYYGFDSATFSKATYGPDRPEELIVVQPFETLVMDVTTKPTVFFTDATKTATTSDTTAFSETVGSNSAEVRFKIFQDLFGRSDYYRQTVEAATTTTANLEIFHNEISVADASTLPEASEIQPAAIWIQGERITYELRDTATNKLKGITRGTRGTTPNTLIVSGAEVRNGQETENIKLVGGDGKLVRDPELYNWIRPVQIFDNQVPFDDDFDGTGSLTGFQANVTTGLQEMTTDGDTGDLLYDAQTGNTSVRSDGSSVSTDGYDAHYDENKIANGESYDGQIIESIGGNTYILYHDINTTDGFDSGSKGVKDAISITDKGSVLEANSSIIDFLHNFNNN